MLTDVRARRTRNAGNRAQPRQATTGNFVQNANLIPRACPCHCQRRYTLPRKRKKFRYPPVPTLWSHPNMRPIFTLTLTFVLGALTTMSNADDTSKAHKHSDHECALNFKMKNIDGETVDLEDYEGNVVLIVNVASECGLTGQYAGLQQIYKKYEDQGFVVLGFPCNQFGKQEPGSEADIKKFCSTEFNVSFPMFSKIEVKGDGAADLYKYLTSKEVKPAGKGKVGWNFEKFLIDRNGQLVSRFSPQTKPSDGELIKAIEEQLNAKG